MCMSATLSASLLSGKGRGDWEALEGLRLGVGSLEGSLGLLSWDFHPWTSVNPSSSIEGVAEEVEVEAVPHCGGGGNSILGASVDLVSLHLRLVLPKRRVYGSEVHLYLPGLQLLQPHYTPPWGLFQELWVEDPSPLL